MVVTGDVSVTCKVCHASVEVGEDENGWPTLRDASAFVERHAECLRLVTGEPSARRPN